MWCKIRVRSMSLWDLGVAEGGLAAAIVLGIAVHSAFPNAGKPKIARNCFWAAWAIFAGFALMWGITTDEYSLLPRLLIVGFLSAVAGVGIVESARFIMHKQNPVRVTVTAPVPFEGQGGKGGDAKVGGSGMAIGGPGGAAGKYGRGGDGGGGEVAGDGIAAGGEGGVAGDDNLWRPPARSGYEVCMERTWPTPDRFMKQFGRGAGGGYAPSQPVRFNQPAQELHPRGGSGTSAQTS